MVTDQQIAELKERLDLLERQITQLREWKSRHLRSAVENARTTLERAYDESEEHSVQTS